VSSSSEISPLSTASRRIAVYGRTDGRPESNIPPPPILGEGQRNSVSSVRCCTTTVCQRNALIKGNKETTRRLTCISLSTLELLDIGHDVTTSTAVADCMGIVTRRSTQWTSVLPQHWAGDSAP